MFAFKRYLSLVCGVCNDVRVNTSLLIYLALEA